MDPTEAKLIGAEGAQQFLVNLLLFVPGECVPGEGDEG
jgi:hypothetical protein